MKPTKTFDQERINFNLARLKKAGGNYELVVDPDKAIAFKEGESVNIEEVIKSEDIFFDAKKGEHASLDRMNEVFGSSNNLEIAKIILSEGEIQLTAEHRAKVRENKRKKIIDLICKNASDPKTKLPHPPLRIERAMDEAKIRIEEFKRAEDQVSDIIKALRPVIPITVETRKVSVHVPTNHAAKLYGVLQGYGKISQERWLDDGSWKGVVELPGGLINEFFDKLNSDTHGSVHTEIIE